MSWQASITLLIQAAANNFDDAQRLVKPTSYASNGPTRNKLLRSLTRIGSLGQPTGSRQSPHP